MTARQIYDDSDAGATRALYAELKRRGPLGEVAMNLFRAQKASSRAKRYRGGIQGVGSYRDLAYERKDWALDQLCDVIAKHATALGFTWGWGKDSRQPWRADVLYIDLPQGQVSFHSARRHAGPDYPGQWDGLHLSEARIVAFAESVRKMPVGSQMTLEEVGSTQQ